MAAGEVVEEVGDAGGEGFGVVTGRKEGVQGENGAKGAAARKLIKGADGVIQHASGGVCGDEGGEVGFAG